MSPPPERVKPNETDHLSPNLHRKKSEGKEKINNCIANKKSFYYENNKDEYEKAKRFFILWKS